MMHHLRERVPLPYRMPVPVQDKFDDVKRSTKKFAWFVLDNQTTLITAALAILFIGGEVRCNQLQNRIDVVDDQGKKVGWINAKTGKAKFRLPA